VIRSHVLAALHAGVVAGDDDAARAALAHADWILRGPTRRRFELALIDASLATGVLDPATPEEARHRLRAAALIAGGASGAAAADPADAGAVARAYAELAPPRPARAPLATIAAVLATAAVLIGVLGASRGIVAAGPGPFERPAPAAPAGVFRDGGAPPRDAAIEQVLAADLPAVVHAGAARRPEAIAALREHAAFAGRGAALHGAWRGFVDHLDRWLALDPERAGYRRIADELRARAIALSDLLAAAQLGYYLEATLVPEHGRRSPGIATYRIEDVSFVRARTERIRVLGLRRLDRPDDRAALGVASGELDDPVVLLGPVEDKVRDQILPVLGGADFPIGDDSWAGSRRGRELARTAGAAIRRELSAALGPDALSAERATARCRRIVASSVGRHEAQHGLDRARGELRHPQPLVAVLGRATHTFALRARLELSAYTSQIASDTWVPQLVLWNLARHAFRATTVGNEESYVALVILEGLARRFGGEPTGPLLRADGEIDRERLAALVLPLAAIGTLELRSAAAALWTELYGEPLVRIYDDL
jgi:hypothetical protein